MEPGEGARKALDIIESETRDLVPSAAPTRKSETEVEIAPLVQKIAATSIAEVEKITGELQAAKDFMESEGERVQREAEHYTTLTQMASASIKIISDTVAGWREAGHPLRDHSRFSQFDLSLSPVEDNSTRVSGQHQPQPERPIRARTRTASGEEQSSPV
jgi:Zn-dependent M32 family carboxypeptidase